MDSTARANISGHLRRIKRTHFTPGCQATDEQAFGLLLAAYATHDGLFILRAAQYALEDANFHAESGEVAAMADKYDVPDPDAIIDAQTRSALFASLTERFGKLDRTERLHKLNVLAGREPGNPITSLSDYRGNMTNGDARRVFDVLNVL
jgi:hypothetical protein